MTNLNYNILAALPALGELGTLPEISLEEYLEIIAQNRAATSIFRIILLADDLRVRNEILLGNEGAKENLIILDPDKINDFDCILPFFSGAAQKILKKKTTDCSLLQTYFEMALCQAKNIHSDFLADWVCFEVELRKVLVTIRAEKLKRDISKLNYCENIESSDFDFSTFINDFVNVSDPLEGDKLIENLRWDWLNNHDSWFKFSDDEVVAYGVKLLSLHRWYRLRHGTPVASNAYVVSIQ